MALNKTILKKVEERTKNDPEIKDFLIDLMMFESGRSGWYDTKYSELLEEHCKEDYSK